MQFTIALAAIGLANVVSAVTWSIDLYAGENCDGDYASYHNDYIGNCNIAGDPYSASNPDNCVWNTDAGQSDCTGPMVPRPASFLVGKNSECKINTGTSCSAGKTYTNADGCVKLYYQIGDESDMIFECNGS